MNNQPSLADRFIDTMSRIREIDADVTNENPHRHILRSLRAAAERVVSDALLVAVELAHVAAAMKSYTRDEKSEL
mgnify:CR=1 FL=1